jgi:hypothetical protein
VPDVLAEIIAEPRSLFEEVNGRPDDVLIFISSRMRGYEVVREQCAKTIEGTGIMRAWYWERDARAGPRSAPHVCLQRAGTSDGLILIVGRELSDITRQEYEAATGRHIPTFVFVDQSKKQTKVTKDFIAAAQGKVTTGVFANENELRSNVLNAVRECNSRMWRTAAHGYWEHKRSTP